MAQHLTLSGDFHTRAAFEPATFNEKAGTVEVVFSTGARALRNSWDGPFYEELEISEQAVDLSRLNNGAPFMDDHPMKRGLGGVRGVIGVVERAWIKGAEGRALVRFSEREDVKPIVADVKAGILRHVSVGYTIEQLDLVEKVKEVPVYRAIRWTPYEISQTPVAVDDAAVVRGRPQSEPYEVEILSRSKEQTMEPKTPVTSAAAAPAPVVQPDPAEVTRAAETATVAELERCTVIRSLVTKHGLGEEFSAKLIADRVKLDAARGLILEKLAEGSDKIRTMQHIVSVPGGDEREKFQRGAGAWLIEKAGVLSLISDAAAKKVRGLEGIELNGGEFRGLSLLDIARECLERSGIPTRRMSSKDIVGRAFTERGGIGGQTTSDFGVLFENVMGKILLGAYALAPNTWSRFCKADTVSDFRPSPRYRTGSLGVLEKVNEAGEFRQIAMPDGVKSSISTETKGKILGLTRQAIINDDMAALADAAQKLGRAAQLSIEVDVYALLALNSGLGPTQTDSQPFFHANRANVNATGAALSVLALDADRVIMRKQKDPNNQEVLDLRPAILLVSAENETTATLLNSAPYDPADAKYLKPNTAKAMFRDVVGTPRLTGNRRYLFADPNDAAAIVVAFLEGQGQAPMLESKEGWRTDGTEWKVKLDYKVQEFDAKGGVTNAGQ